MREKAVVIVPVYNVKRYLEQCIQSLSAQDYDHFEVILVDDGSTDGSGELCDAAAEKDPRFRVIHQENRGQSAARNAGSACADGKYIAFIDADDWVTGDYLSRQIDLMEAYDCDIAACRQEAVWGTEQGKTETKTNASFAVFHTEQAIEEMCYGDRFGVHVAKIYRTELIRKHPYPEGKIYEDMGTTYKVIGDCRRLVFVDAPLYKYRQRAGSTMHETYSERHLVMLEQVENLCRYVEKRFPAVKSAAVCKKAWAVTHLTPMVIAAGRRDVFRVLQNTMKSCYRTVFKNKRQRFFFKVRCVAVTMGFYPAKIVFTTERLIKEAGGRTLQANG